jgi:integrase/recombinase XerD
MHTSTSHPISLHAANGTRKYLTGSERRRFLKTAACTQPPLRLFCFVLGWSGGRLSEVLAVTPATIDAELGAVNLRTLKRRKPGVIRQVPLPDDVLADLERDLDLRARQRDPARAHKRLWPWSRTTA